MARRPVPLSETPVPGKQLGALGQHFLGARPFTPFQMPDRPPAGMFDPMLESQQAAAGRGLTDLRSDAALQGARSLTDYMTALHRMGLQRQYEQQDYARNTGLLQRRFNILGSQQGQAANAAGLEGAGGSGFDAAAAAARAQNQGIEQTGMDIAHQRAQTAQDLSQAQLGLQYNRAGEDRSIMQSRAGRENAFFGNDIGQEEAYQAAFMGYVPPTGPANQYAQGGVNYQVNPSGVPSLPSGQYIGRPQLRQRLLRGGYQGSIPQYQQPRQSMGMFGF